MNLAVTLRAIAQYMPDHPALLWREEGRERTLSYGAFEAVVARIAGALRTRHGLAAGARVGIAMENRPEFYPVLYGIWRAGLAAVPVNAKLHAKELAWILDNAGARLCVASEEIAGRLLSEGGGGLPELIVAGTVDYRRLTEGEPVAVGPAGPADDAWLFYTSGTTGRPKGAVLSHRNLIFMCHAYYADIDALSPADTMLHAAPLSHGAGLYGLAHIAKGATNVILPAFEAGEVLAAFARFSNVSMFAAPTMVVRLLAHGNAGGDTSGLKTIVYGGAPMYVADLRRGLELLGPRFYQLYGQGESPMTISGLTKAMHADTGHPRYEARLGSAGIARTGVAFRIVDEAGRELPAGEVGEIVTRSDCVMTGYHANPDADARALREGWLWTGDMGAVDGDGFLTLKDRSKDLIISGGSNIYPREVEEVLLLHADVAECAVVSRPHPQWGEEVVAFVVARAGSRLGADELDRLCLANIARFKRPKHYRFVAALPKNNYGKVLKRELRELLLAE